MGSNKSTIFTGGGIPSPYNVIFLSDDGKQRATTIDGFEINQKSGGGIWASTESPDIASMIGHSGPPGENGSLTSTEAKDVFAAVGYPAVVGSFIASEARDTFSAFMTLPKTGTWTSTEAPDRFNAAGVGYGENGVLVSTEAKDTFAAVGNTPIAGVWASSEVPDQFNAFATGVVATQKRRVFFVT